MVVMWDIEDLVFQGNHRQVEATGISRHFPSDLARLPMGS